MSAEATFWAWKQTISHSPSKLVLLCLANYSNHEHASWPSVSTIVEDTHLGKRTVMECLDNLEKLGLLKRTPRIRDNGSRTSSIITLQIGQIILETPSAPAAHTQCDGRTAPSAPAAHPEPNKKNLTLNTPLTPQGDGLLVIKCKARDTIFDAIATECGFNLAEINSASGSMIAKAKQLIRQSSPEVTPQDIINRCEAYRRKMPKVLLTPTALAKHWPTLGTATEPKDELL